MNNLHAIADKTRRDLIFPVGTVFTISVIIISALVYIAANSLNRISEEKSVHLAGSVIASHEDTLNRLNIDTAYWDQAVEKLVYSFDPVWATDNIGIFLYESFDTYSSYAIDPENRATYSMIEGENVEDNPVERMGEPFRVLLEQARISAPMDDTPVPVSGFVRDGNRILLVSATRLTTYENIDGEEVSIGTHSVLVMTQDINIELLDALGAQYLLSGFHLDLSSQPPQKETALVLKDETGNHIGTLLWQTDHPGTEMLKWMVPVIALLFILMGGLVYLTVARANRVSEKVLHEENLRHEMDKAMEQSQKLQALGTLVGGVAHNFNNLLQPILMLSMSLRNATADNSQERKDLDVMIEACNRGVSLVEQISLFSREDKSDTDGEDIYSVVQQGLKLASSTIPTTITVNTDLDQNTGTVLLDATEALTVLMNLISNAVDAMHGHVGTLSVALSPAKIDEGANSAAPTLPKGQYAHLVVGDTGTGMDTETLNRVFEPFFTTKDVGKGTGLGLSTAYSIVTRSGGSISTTSAPQKGATIDVYIPLAPTNDAHMATATHHK